MNSGEHFAGALAAHEDAQRPSAVTALLTAAKDVAAECRAGGDATRSTLASLCMAVDGIDSLSEVVKLDEYDKLVERCVDLSEQVERFRGLYAQEAHKKQILLEERDLLLLEIRRVSSSDRSE